MRFLVPLIGVAALVALAWLGVEKGRLHSLFGVVIPYLAVGLFVVGCFYRVLWWARSHVPFRITTTCGQQKTLPFLKSSPVEAPSSKAGVWLRMAFEVLTFRSLFRNTRTELKEGGQKLVFGPTKWLWLGALVFHYSFLVIFLRHLKFFAQPVPGALALAGELDGFFQVGLPVLYLTDVAILLGLGFLLVRRLFIPQLRYISLAADYFPLFLIISIAASGILMRYFYKVDVVAVKELGMGLLAFSPKLPDPKLVPWQFYAHLLLVSALVAYFPFSKLTHMLGVFLSPTRNMANDNRMRRHENTWDPRAPELQSPETARLRTAVYPNWDHPHTYKEYEEEFLAILEKSGFELEYEHPKPKPPDATAALPAAPAVGAAPAQSKE